MFVSYQLPRSDVHILDLLLSYLQSIDAIHFSYFVCLMVNIDDVAHPLYFIFLLRLVCLKRLLVTLIIYYNGSTSMIV